MSSISLCTQAKALGDMNKVTALPPQGGWLASVISLFPRVEGSGDVNKVATSPPRGGGL